MKINLYDFKKSRGFYFLALLYICAITTHAHIETRPFLYPETCSTKQDVNDCSRQFENAPPESCLIYNTKACESKSFPPWTLNSLLKPVQESNSYFTARILPYLLYIHDIHEKEPVTAVNILLTSINKNINGYSIVLTDNLRDIKPVCRIIDFRNSTDYFIIPFTLSFDCFNLLREDSWKNVTITFTAYPLNVELSYLAYFPPKPRQNYTSCDWVPLVMIYRESLPANHVQFKFSNAPPEMNILFFIASLHDTSGFEAKRIEIPSVDKNDMISSEFHSVEGGFYSLSISIILVNSSCTSFKSNFIFVGHEIKDYSLLILIILLVIMNISAFGLVYIWCQWYLKSVVPLASPTLVFVYSHRHLLHAFLKKYAEYLKKHYGINVNLIYKRSGDPKSHLEDTISESDIIVLVLTQDLIKTFEQNASIVECEHPWIEQLPDALAVIRDSISRGKRKCKVCLTEKEKQNVPKRLELMGPLFMLPDSSDNFLCFIFDCPKRLKLLSKIFCVNHHRVSESEDLVKDLKKVKESLKKVVENKTDEVPDKNITLDITGNKPNYLLSHNSKNISQDECENLSDEENNPLSLDILDAECKNPLKVIDQKNYSLMSDTLENNHKNINTELPEQVAYAPHGGDELLRKWFSDTVNFKHP